HVIDSAMPDAGSLDSEQLAQGVHDRMEEEYADLFDEARSNPNIESVELKVMAGGITETLADVIIPEFDPDLVVCCRRGLSGIRYAFVGSVSTYLIRNLRCDVLVVSK
ncbi:MAG: universal stress protein, partial [Eggerthellaceae bacterium]|nr:universal stress protein [Eggerthellaceae bacterium]